MDQPVFLVTGGASPIGQAITRQIVREGGAAAIHYQSSKKRAVEFCQSLKEQGSDVFLLQGDLDKPDATRGLIRKVINHWGKLDCVVNNASLFKPTPFRKSSSGDWEKIFRVNTLSPYFLSTAAFPWLQKTEGAVVHITDIYGSHPLLKDFGAYCASKAALVALTHFMAREMGPKVRVNAVSPGAITFPVSYHRNLKNKIIKRSALNRSGRPEDIASAVLFLAKHPFITGQVLDVDGGRFSG